MPRLAPRRGIGENPATMADSEIHGFCDERFAGVRAAFEENFRQGLELGASFALAVGGELAVDLWGGHADRARARPWQRDTLAAVYSTSKVASALCGLIAVDRGLLELDAPVARYWPEFAAAGKSEIPVRHVFCHATGVPTLNPPIAAGDLTDPERAAARLAAQAPWWEPGTRSGYHGVSFSFLIGELIRRTSGLSLERFLREAVTERIGADFRFHLPDSELHRLAEPQMDGERTQPAETFGSRVQGALLAVCPLDDPAWRRSIVNGYGNARSLVRLGSVLACGGGLDGQRLLSADTARLAGEEQIYSHDLVLDMPVRFGLGFGLVSDEFPLPFPNAFHWGGYGGSSLIMEPDRQACWSYVPTRLDPAEILDARGARLIAAACAGVAGLAV